MQTEIAPLAEQVEARECAYKECGKTVDGAEFVIQRSTEHVRWFCSIDHACASLDLVYELVHESLGMGRR